MKAKDKNKLAQTYRNLPITELICIAPGSYAEEAIKIAWDIIVERRKEVISFFQKMKPFELFSNVAPPDFTKYNPAAFIVIKQVFSERKKEMLKQLEIMEEIVKGFEETTREIEKALQCNVAYRPREGLQSEYKEAIAILEGKKGWFVDRLRSRAKRRLEKEINKPPRKLDEYGHTFLQQEIESYKRSIATWNEVIKPKILELLKIATTKTD